MSSQQGNFIRHRKVSKQDRNQQTTHRKYSSNLHRTFHQLFQGTKQPQHFQDKPIPPRTKVIIPTTIQAHNRKKLQRIRTQLQVRQQHANRLRRITTIQRTTQQLTLPKRTSRQLKRHQPFHIKTRNRNQLHTHHHKHNRNQRQPSRSRTRILQEYSQDNARQVT